jgi:hypothetical protein
LKLFLLEQRPPIPYSCCRHSFNQSTMAVPYRQATRQQSRQMSTDPRNELHPHVNHYIGIDVGTGSARACIMNDQGDIVGLASENIGLWQPQTGYYVSHLSCDSCRVSTDGSRNNRPRTSGDVSALLSGEQWTSTTLTVTPFAALGSTLLARSQSSRTIQTSQSPSPGQTSTTRTATTATSYCGSIIAR